MLGTIKFVERPHTAMSAQMVKEKGPIECHEEYLKKLTSEKLNLRENELRQRKLAKEILSLSQESAERKTLIRIKSSLIKQAREIKSGQVPSSSTRRSLTSKELKILILGQIEFLTGKNTKLKNMLAKELMVIPEITIAKLRHIFSNIEKAKDIIFDNIERYVEYDIFNKPDYSKSKNFLERQLSNTFRDYSSLASVIYILIFVNEKKHRNKIFVIAHPGGATLS